MPCSFLNPSIPPYLSTSVCDSCSPPSLLSIYPYCHFTPFSSLHPPLHSSLTFAPGPSLLPPPSASEPFPSLYWLRTASRWRARQQCRALPPGKHGKKSPKTLRRCVHCRVSRVTQKLYVRAPTHSQACIYMQVFITQLARRAALLNDDFLVTQFIPSFSDTRQPTSGEDGEAGAYWPVCGRGPSLPLFAAMPAVRASRILRWKVHMLEPTWAVLCLRCCRPH